MLVSAGVLVLVILLVRSIDVSVLLALCVAWIVLEGCALYLDSSEDHSGPQSDSMTLCSVYRDTVVSTVVYVRSRVVR